MKLFDLCHEHPSVPDQSVPGWTLGCFRRSSISFFSGESDHSTLVLWLQSCGLTADLRLDPDRPKLRTREELFDLSLEALTRLAAAEGGLSPSRFTPSEGAQDAELSGVMTWLDWTAFQTHAKWPEPGLLRRVGDCLIEFAPSGAYVEDWRL
jgi:hypothetical protein